MIKRIFDIALAMLAAVFLALPCLGVGVVIKLTSKGPVLFWSQRVGKNNQIFNMPKFRSMFLDTPTVATHLLTDAPSHVTAVGRFLRRTSIDELPQIWSIFIGDMSFVGPRPALFNQDDLIRLRSEYGVSQLRPGLTGLAQVNGRDDISIAEKVVLDVRYLERRSFLFDLIIVWTTFKKVLQWSDVSH